MEPNIGFYTAKQVTLAGKQKTSIDLEIDLCGTSNFNFDAEDTVKYGISDYYCLTDHNYELIGDYYSDKYVFLEIKLNKCQNNSANTASLHNPSIVCKPETVIDNWINNQVLSFAFVNSLFLNDKYYPLIKRFIDDSLFFELNSVTTKKADFYVMQSEAETVDQILAFGDPLVTNFANIENVRSYEGNY